MQKKVVLKKGAICTVKLIIKQWLIIAFVANPLVESFESDDETLALAHMEHYTQSWKSHYIMTNVLFNLQRPNGRFFTWLFPFLYIIFQKNL